MKLAEYVIEHTVQGKKDIDMFFFKVGKKNRPTKEVFLDLVRKEYPNWLDGKEHSYIHIGADMDSQELALMTMGLGVILDVWNLLAPNTIMPFLPYELQKEMAGQGMVSIQYKEAQNE